MKPLFVGYTNHTRDPDEEAPHRRATVNLTDEDLITHIHGVGATRSGKSKWLEWFCRELYRQGLGFTVIDPQGKLSRDLLDYFAYIRPRRPIIYFDPSRTDYLVPFNAFRMGQDEISIRVEKQVEAILRVWGAENSDETPRLERWLRCICHLFASGHVSINEVSDILSWPYASVRESIADLLKGNRVIQNEWLELLSYKKTQEFSQQIESARNRLFRFISNPQLRRIMSLEEKSLDFLPIFEEGAIVIANLAETDVLAEKHARLLGALIINELWAAVRKDRPKPPRNPYFLLIDEVQKFITPDLKEILDRGAGKGLHLGVFHQHLVQFKEQDPWTFASIMTNARLKLVFGGLTKEDTLLMADEMFANQISYDEAKFMIEQTKFWPVYGRDTIYTSSRGESSGRGTQTQTGDTMGRASTTTFNLEGGGFFGVPQSITKTTTSTVISSRGDSTFAAESWSEGEADVPIFYPIPFKEVSSIETYSLEEQKNRLADRLKEQYQRHYFIKRPGRNTVAAVTPFVKDFPLSPHRIEAYILDHLIKPYALSVEDIDQQLEDKLRSLESKLAAPSLTAAELISTEEPYEPTTFRHRKKG